MAEKRVCSKCHTSTREKLLHVPVIWMIGAPGSGKTIQSDKIVAAYGLQHISTGNLVSRQFINPHHSTSASMLSVVACGVTMDTEVLVKHLINEIKLKADSATGFVIDGFPRSKKQASLFEDSVGHVDVIFLLEAPPEVLTARLAQRRDSSQQFDDNTEPLTERFARFETVKEEIIKTYKDKVIIINANKKPAEVFKEINKYLVALVE